jgi:hypothetical protein
VERQQDDVEIVEDDHFDALAAYYADGDKVFFSTLLSAPSSHFSALCSLLSALYSLLSARCYLLSAL